MSDETRRSGAPDWKQLSMVGDDDLGGESVASRRGRPNVKVRAEKEGGEEVAQTTSEAVSVPTAAASPSLEAALLRLEAIVRELEAGNIDLDRSLALFEEGVSLSRLASKRLTEAEVKITKLVRSLEGGFTTEPFEEGEGSDGGKERG